MKKFLIVLVIVFGAIVIYSACSNLSITGTNSSITGTNSSITGTSGNPKQLVSKAISIGKNCPKNTEELDEIYKALGKCNDPDNSKQISEARGYVSLLKSYINSFWDSYSMTDTASTMTYKSLIDTVLDELRGISFN